MAALLLKGAKGNSAATCVQFVAMVHREASSGKCRKKAKISRRGGGEAGGVGGGLGGGGQIEREEKQEEVEEKDR